MEQTALRPKPLPGTTGGARGYGPGPRPRASRRRGRRLVTVCIGLLFAVGLVLTGVGLGTISATVIGMSRLADVQGQGGGQPSAVPVASGTRPAGAEVPGRSAGSAEASGPAGATRSATAQDEYRSNGARHRERTQMHAPARPDVRVTLGVEAVDAPAASGALLVGVHVSGPGYTAGLVRGDVLLAFGAKRLHTAADLASAVAAARPGVPVRLTVRHVNGARQMLWTTPGVMT